MRAPFGSGRRRCPTFPAQRRDGSRRPQGDAPRDTGSKSDSDTSAPLVSAVSPRRGTSPELPGTAGRASLLLDEPVSSSRPGIPLGPEPDPYSPIPARFPRRGVGGLSLCAGTTVTPSSALEAENG